MIDPVCGATAYLGVSSTALIRMGSREGPEMPGIARFPFIHALPAWVYQKVHEVCQNPASC